MSAFKVGDVVEVVGRDLDPKYIGLILVVTRIGLRFWDLRWRNDGVFCMPDADPSGKAWAPEDLRKINPPDWSAEGMLTTVKEVTA